MLNYSNYCSDLTCHNTFSELCDVFFSDPYNNFSKVYRSNLRSEFRKHVFPVIGSVKLRDLASTHIRQTRDHVKACGRNHFFLYRTDHMICRICDYAIMHDLIASSPFLHLPSVSYRPAYDLTIYTDEQLSLIGSAINETRFPYVFAFGLTTGLVLPEILGIQEGDFDSAALTLTIQRTVTLPHKGQKLTYGVPKVPRTIYLSNVAGELLAKQLELYHIAQEAYGEVEPYIFLSDFNNRPSYHLLQREYHAIAARASLESFSFDTMRHNYTLRCLMANVNVFDLQFQLGMKSPDYLLHLDSALKKHSEMQASENAIAIEIPMERR